MPKVLLVEDEPMLARIVRDSLEVRGFRVTHALNGRQALQLYREETPDILVLDVMMPQLDGFSVARQIRRSDRQPPIIFPTPKSQTIEPEPAAEERYELGRYVFDPARQSLSHPGGERLLSHRESELLRRLCQHRNQVLERSRVLRELWGDDHFFNARSMDVFITKLRRYLEEDPAVKIVNVRGVGYKLIVDREDDR